MSNKGSFVDVLSTIGRWNPVSPDYKFQFQCSDECRKYSDCCKEPPALLPSEACELADYIGLSLDDFFDNYCSIKEVETNEGVIAFHAVLRLKGDYCILLDQEKNPKDCSVHGHHPYPCITYPLKVLPIGKPTYFLASCPGIGKGHNYSVKDWLKENDIDVFARTEELSSYYRKLRELIGDKVEQLPITKSRSNKKFRKDIKAVRREAKQAIRQLFLEA